MAVRKMDATCNSKQEAEDVLLNIISDGCIPHVL
jgi:hypothetical protein